MISLQRELSDISTASVLTTSIIHPLFSSVRRYNFPQIPSHSPRTIHHSNISDRNNSIINDICPKLGSVVRIYCSADDIRSIGTHSTNQHGPIAILRHAAFQSGRSLPNARVCFDFNFSKKTVPPVPHELPRKKNIPN